MSTATDSDSPTVNKACPIVLRDTTAGTEVLVFEHPLAGIQLVKGTIERNETVAEACQRELTEESGLYGTPALDLGTWSTGFENQVWGLMVMHMTSPIPERFEFFTQDDGGHRFRFFWHPLMTEPDARWHPLFQNALKEIQTRLLATNHSVR